MAIAYNYDAYGNELEVAFNGNDDAEAHYNVFRYTGREGTYTNDAGPNAAWGETTPNVYHYRSREYLPGIGQFNRMDDYRPVFGNPNLYGYVEGNPVNRTDPMGYYHGGVPTFGNSSASGHRNSEYLSKGMLQYMAEAMPMASITVVIVIVAGKKASVPTWLLVVTAGAEWSGWFVGITGWNLQYILDNFVFDEDEEKDDTNCECGNDTEAPLIRYMRERNRLIESLQP